MQIRFSILNVIFSIVLLWGTSFWVSCNEDFVIDTPNEQLSREGICFGVSKDASSWKPDSRAFSKDESKTLTCYSNDPTFGVSVETNWRDTPANSFQSRGAQFTADSTLTQFEVTAFYYEENATTAETFFTETVTDGVNTTGKTYYWPREGSMDFIAIAPIGIANPMPTVDDYNTHSKAEFTYTIPDNISEQRDIMVAVSKGLTKETGNPVPLNFKHLLASVRFKVGEMQFIKINSLTLSGVYGGDVTFIYNKNTNTWTNSVPTTIKTYNPDFVDTSGLPQGSEIAGNVNNATLFMIPQTLPADAEIRVSYTELLTGNTGTGIANIGKTTWEAGKDYAYAFNIGNKFDVTIPTPDDQDAHYIMLEMPYEVGALSDYITSIKATARFLDDGSNTSTKSGISLKFKSDLTQTQKDGFWTDEQWEVTVTNDSDGNPVSSDTTFVKYIRGEGELSIGTNLSNTIVLFVEENNGTTHRNGELVFTATLKNGTNVVIGQGNFKQLCASWNDAGIGVERIESSNVTYPYGFSYNRVVTYTNEWKSIPILRWICGLVASSNVNADGKFIKINYESGLWGVTYIKTIVVDYTALTGVQQKAGSSDGLVNTKALYNATGSNDFSAIETTLNNISGFSDGVANPKGEGMPSEYAAFIALKCNRMKELKVTVESSTGNVESYKSLLYKDSQNNDIIEWYLPSSEEAKTLVETGLGSNVISSLHGEYWSSTAGSDADAFAHSYTYYNNSFGAINDSKPRMNVLKVRAVRKKP